LRVKLGEAFQDDGDMGNLEKITIYHDQLTLEEKIIAAMSKSKVKWRTVRTLSKELGEDPAHIAGILLNSNKFVKARKSNSRGEALYSTSSRYRKQTPLWGRFLSAGANSVID
jgi:hypothetical protein